MPRRTRRNKPQGHRPPDAAGKACAAAVVGSVMYIAWLASARRHEVPQWGSRIWKEANNYLTIPKGTGDDFAEKADQWAMLPQVLKRYRLLIVRAYLVKEHVAMPNGGGNRATAYRFAALLAKANLSLMAPDDIKRQFRRLELDSADRPIKADGVKNVSRKKVPERSRKRKREAEHEGEEEDEQLAAVIEDTIVTTKPNVRWNHIAGLEGAKKALRQAVVYPLQMPQLFTAERKPWQAILLYGPPGTGKTHLARAIATEAACTFFSVSTADLMSKWHGESERTVRTLFRIARERKPSVVFVDEIDTICSSRDAGSADANKILTEFLCQVDGLKGDNAGVLVLGATNLPGKLDIGMRRRFQCRIEVPLPDVHARADIIKIHIGNTPHALTESDIKEIAQATEGYSGSDIRSLVQAALYQPFDKLENATHFKELRGPNPHASRKTKLLVPCAPQDPDPTKRKITLCEISDLKSVTCPVVTRTDFKKAFSSARLSVSQADLEHIDAFTRDFGQKA
eukprot:TRINITY_DN1438_c0_g1_i3.p1 TRINITY_DN1438_c0_g1~~TRINITY_DN1438_c0_g1_i3.p1  ORF type:complete len:541 (+),score=143.73 TRINITY_DN1438_c0_g1_i3:90-1625(+)